MKKNTYKKRSIQSVFVSYQKIGGATKYGTNLFELIKAWFLNAGQPFAYCALSCTDSFCK